MKTENIDRRKFIQIGSTGAMVAIAWPFVSACDNLSSQKDSTNLSKDFKPDLDIELSAVERKVSLLSGEKTEVWMFKAKLLEGDSAALQELGDAYLGPVIKVRKGQKVRIRFINQLPEKSIVHWHGMLIVTDKEEENLNLPSGEFDLPVVIQDRSLDNNNQLVYLDRGRMDRMMGDRGMMGERGMMKDGGMMKNMMQMPHPIHLHQVQFNILERDTSEMDEDVWNSIKDGLINDGWQDTVLLMPGMKIKIIMRFEDFKGLFLYHCHNLEHEDMGMMRNYKIS
jgi:FtsP/CotA-like multicopper oxidase with cupredoxin domain